MPDIDARIFALALNGFLFFGAANLTVELITSFVVLCKKLKATIKAPYDLGSGKLKPATSADSAESHKLKTALIEQLLALTPEDRQVISSILGTLSAGSYDVGNVNTHTSDAAQPEHLGWLPVSRNVSRSSLTNGIAFNRRYATGNHRRSFPSLKRPD